MVHSNRNQHFHRNAYRNRSCDVEKVFNSSTTSHHSNNNNDRNDVVGHPRKTFFSNLPSHNKLSKSLQSIDQCMNDTDNTFWSKTSSPPTQCSSGGGNGGVVGSVVTRIPTETEYINRANYSTVVYKQKVGIRYLQPPTPKPLGPIFVKESSLMNNERSVSPILIRQRPPEPRTPSPLILREKPNFHYIAIQPIIVERDKCIKCSKLREAWISQQEKKNRKIIVCETLQESHRSDNLSNYNSRSETLSNNLANTDSDVSSFSISSSSSSSSLLTSSTSSTATLSSKEDRSGWRKSFKLNKTEQIPQYSNRGQYSMRRNNNSVYPQLYLVGGVRNRKSRKTIVNRRKPLIIYERI
ncbi:hypothetical protein SNEBB_007309 [Seison nebaliae]|nr:hypothetical protein SNEBB_007309 [Seison nebaliae]